MASAFALVAVFLRVVLPLLHTHDHQHLPFSASGDAAAVSICSCGVVHSPVETGEQLGWEFIDKAPSGHYCLACELEEGTPFAFPPAGEWNEFGHAFAELVGFAAVESFAASQVRLAQSRAPPSQRA